MYLKSLTEWPQWESLSSLVFWLLYIYIFYMFYTGTKKYIKIYYFWFKYAFFKLKKYIFKVSER